MPRAYGLFSAQYIQRIGENGRSLSTSIAKGVTRPAKWPLATAVLACLSLAACNDDSGGPNGNGGGETPPIFAKPVLAKVPLPPMGWSSWNAYGTQINDERILKNAKEFQLLVNPDRKKDGLYYINIDEGWWKEGPRDKDGKITTQIGRYKDRFPNGMAVIAKQIHDLGFKAGIYTDAGPNGCYGNRPADGAGAGSYGHYKQDFKQFIEWGFDYVKVDWCGGEGARLDPKKTYTEVSEAVSQAEVETGGNLVLSICEWGRDDPWNWAPGLGRLWRTSGDIAGPNTDTPIDKAKIYEIIYKNNYHPTGQHTGYYNDADMMLIGEFRWTETVNQSHMGMWAISGAPLIQGNKFVDVGPILDFNTPPFLKARDGNSDKVQTNATAVAIDQDPLSLQGLRVSTSPTGYSDVWAKLLNGPGRRAVLLLNKPKQSFDAKKKIQTDSTKVEDITVSWKDLGLDTAAPVRIVADAWGNGKGEQTKDSYTVRQVPVWGSVLLIVEGKDLPETNHAVDRGSPLTFARIKSEVSGGAVRITYVNAEKLPIVARMKLNDEASDTAIYLPPTDEAGAMVYAYVNLSKGDKNTLVFAAGKDGKVPDIRAVATVAGPIDLPREPPAKS